MQCYFNLVSPHQSIIDNEGIAVADADGARVFARAAISEMVQDGTAEIAHWRGWEIEARDASGTVLFTMGFDILLTAETQEVEVQAVVPSVTDGDSTYAYGKAA